MSLVSKIRKPALIGYVILAIGTGFAINGVYENQNDTVKRGLVVRGVICSIVQEEEIEAIKNLHSPLVKKLGISQPDLEKATEEKLIKYNERREKIAPSTPVAACHSKRLKVK